MVRVKADDYCFACGPRNPHGLHLADFAFDGERYTFPWTPEPYHQGWQGLVHGGLIATVLDEAMTRLVWAMGLEAVTGEVTVRFRRPLPVGTHVQIEAWLVEQRRGVIRAEATMKDGEVEYAHARGTLMRVDGE
ncbi:MAG: PaaI family thioesterase [Armatimonadetes bacterium]|nr:PaaI family thioesterase [Armatimonadota bacterium]